MTKVVIVKVENNDIEGAVRKALQLLGGLSQFISSAEEILLKPNLLTAPKKKEERDKIRTEPMILEVLSKMLIDIGKKVLIADSSAAGHEKGTRSALKLSGYLEIGEKYTNVTVHSLEKNGPVNVNINGKKLKNANIARDIIDAQAIINVPKMKTHALTLYTGAIKNLYGTISGGDKTRIHSLGATNQGFSQCLVDLYAYVKPKIKLNIMDAIIALEGMGPGASGRAVQMGLILASDDAVALDAVAFTLMGHNHRKVLTTRYAVEQNLGENDLMKIKVLGEKIEDHQKKFKLPATAKITSLPFQKFTSITLRIPKYISGCIGCHDCERGCPEKVITIVSLEKGKYKPKINYKNCISCFTCIEICPQVCYTHQFKNVHRIIVVGIIILFLIAIIVLFVLLNKWGVI